MAKKKTSTQTKDIMGKIKKLAKLMIDIDSTFEQIESGLDGDHLALETLYSAVIFRDMRRSAEFILDRPEYLLSILDVADDRSQKRLLRIL